MPEFAPVTRAFWPTRTFQISREGAFEASNCGTDEAGMTFPPRISLTPHAQLRPQYSLKGHSNPSVPALLNKNEGHRRKPLQPRAPICRRREAIGKSLKLLIFRLLDVRCSTRLTRGVNTRRSPCIRRRSTQKPPLPKVSSFQASTGWQVYLPDARQGPLRRRWAAITARETGLTV